MSDSRSQERPHARRWRYLIDRRLQLTVALQLLGVIAAIALAYVLAVYVLFDEASLQAMTAEETRSLFKRANLLYGSYLAVFLVASGIFLTHRVAGPAKVIERAVRGILRGELDHRLTLRPRDHLKSLAAAVAELRSQLREREDTRRELLEEVASCLEAHDVAAARERLVRLGLPKPDPDGAGPSTH